MSYSPGNPSDESEVFDVQLWQAKVGRFPTWLILLLMALWVVIVITFDIYQYQFSAVFIILLIWMQFKFKLTPEPARLTASEQRLVLDAPSRNQTILWNEIDYYLTREADRNMLLSLILRLRSGATLAFQPSSDQEMSRLIAVMQEHQVPENDQLILEVAAKLSPEGDVTLDKYRATDTGLIYNNSLVPWKEIMSINCDDALAGYPRVQIDTYQGNKEILVEPSLLKAKGFQQFVAKVVHYARQAQLDRGLLKIIDKSPATAFAQTIFFASWLCALIFSLPSALLTGQHVDIPWTLLPTATVMVVFITAFILITLTKNKIINDSARWWYALSVTVILAPLLTVAIMIHQ